MLNNFIYAQTKELFLNALNDKQILDEAIVFIEDTKEIWNRGHYFGGDSGIDPEVLSGIETAIATLQSDKADKSELTNYAKKNELPSLDGYLTKTVADGLYATIAQYNTLNQTVGNIQTELSNKLTSADLEGYAKTADVPTKISDLEDDSDFITNTEATAAYAPKSLVETVSNQATTISTLATKDALSTGLAEKLDNSAASDFVPTTRKVNGVALDKDITITATDPNAATKTELNNLSTNLTSEIGKKATSATTLAGYGITDGVNTVDDVQTGTYITDITIEGHTLKTTRGSHTVTGKEVTDALGYTPLQGADITNLASKTDVSNAVTPVSNRVTAIEDLIAADSDAVIDKWDEVVTFLDGIGADNDLEALLAAKANSSTVNALDTRVTNLTTNNIAEGNNLYFTNARAVSALSNTLASYVPTSRTINGKKLTGDITLSASDVGAASASELNTTNTTLANVNAKFANYLNLTGGQLQGSSRIGYSGDELFIGNEENNGWVRFQDICSQEQDDNGDSPWEILETGESRFKKLQLNDGGYLEHDDAGDLIIGNTEGEIYFDQPFGTFGIYCDLQPIRIGKGEDTVAFFTGDIIGSDYHGDDAAEAGYEGEQWRIGFEGDADFRNLDVRGEVNVRGDVYVTGEGSFNTVFVDSTLTARNIIGDVTGNVSGSAGSATYASYLGNSSSNYTKSSLDTALGNKVNKVDGKGLSTNDFTTALKNKLDALPTTFAPTNAEANVQADWNVTDSSSDAFIKNKPTIPTIPNLSGGSAAETGKYVSGVTVSGHTVTVTKGTLPTIPSVGNGTVTVTQNGTTVGSFTMNQSGNTTIALTDTHPDLSSYATQTWVNNQGFKKTDNNTTYTFASGTNGFTVTPSGGSAQTVTVTPSISKNVTYTGTLVDEQVATFEGTSGQIKASGYTIAASVPSGAIFTDTKVTSVGNHYSPAEDANAAISASGGSATNITGTSGKLNVITGLKRDAKGHIVGVTSANIYSTDTTSAVTESTVSGWGFTKNTGTVTGVKINGTTKSPSSGVVDLGTVQDVISDLSTIRSNASNGATAYGWGNHANAGYITEGFREYDCVGIPSNYITDHDEALVAAFRDYIHTSTAVNINNVSASSIDNGKNYRIVFTKDGVPFVNVPWTDTNTDEKTGYASNSTNSDFPILFKPSTSSTTTAAKSAFNTYVTLNPSTRTLQVGSASSVLYYGKVQAGSGFFQTSDETLKNFKESIPIDFEALKSIPKKYFTWKDGDNKIEIGTGAQSLQKVYPELVTDNNGVLTVAYDKLSVIALAAIDKLYDEKKALEERVERLEKFIEKLV